MAEQPKTIRASETISPYGPGAIVDILGQSFMMPTGDHWPPAKLREPVVSARLADALGVQELWAAPTTGEPENARAVGLELTRFPGWLFCGVCRRMVHWSTRLESGESPRCTDDACDGQLVPMRFVLVCTEKSHLDDVPWDRWMHRNAENGCDVKDRLRFQNAERGGEGLSGLEVVCDVCRHRRSLGDLRKDQLAREGFTCRGKQPWVFEFGDCGKPVDPQQRGATSLHFSDVMSAIDIPEVEGRAAEEDERVRAHMMFAAMSAAAGDDLRAMVAAQIAGDLGITVERVLAVGVGGGAGPLDMRATRSSLQADEFEAFMAAVHGTSPMQDFKTRPKKMPDALEGPARALAALVENIVLVDRLRDVRAVMGFRRHRPDAEQVPAVPFSPHEKKWLPAAVGYGEGVFIQLSPEAVRAWAEDPAVGRRGQAVLDNQNLSLLGGRQHFASAEYVMLHTFAHLMIQELAFTSGYTAASLRERVYCEADGDYGVFIYTTTSDVEGTLGGLVRQGEPEHLLAAMTRALEQAAWCPNDPVCLEAQPQSIDGLNHAACHACVLVSETSCESQNLLLDRAFIVGNDSIRGLFSGVLDLMLGQKA